MAVSLESARRLADRIAAVLSVGCERVEIAGSIRRSMPAIKDIDLVVVPRYQPGGLFGDTPVSQLWPLLEQLRADGRLKPLRGWSADGKCITFTVPGAPELKVELNIAGVDNFGSWMAIRTGPEEFSKRLVTPRGAHRRGLLPDGLKWSDSFRLYEVLTVGEPEGAGWRFAEDADEDEFGGPLPGYVRQIPTHEEPLVFESLDIPWIEPQERSGA